MMKIHSYKFGERKNTFIKGYTQWHHNIAHRFKTIRFVALYCQLIITSFFNFMQGCTKFPPFPHQQFFIAHFLWKKWEEIKFEGEEIKK